MKKNIILSNATINNGNLGCVALCYTAIWLIDKVFIDAGKEYTLYLTDSFFPEQGVKKYITIYGRDIEYVTCGYPYPDTLKQKLKKIICYNRYSINKRIFENSDYILDIGQGDSFSDIYGIKRFNSINRIHVTANIVNTKYCILPQTIGPFTDNHIRRLANIAIEKATTVMARDRQSYNYVKENVPNQGSVREYIDCAFFLPYTKQLFEEKYVNVGLNVSGLLWHGGYTGNNELGLNSDYQDIIRSIITYFITKNNVKLHLVSHVLSNNRVIENDYAVCSDLIKMFNSKQVVLAPYFNNPIEAKNYISGLDFFMGARMHSTIAAFSSGVPVVPMAYSRKFNGLFIDTLKYDCMVDLKIEDIECIMRKISYAFEHRTILRHKIEEINSSLVLEKKENLIEELKLFFNLQ